MADELDLLSEIEEFHTEVARKNVRRNAEQIPEGVPGECRECGEEFAHLVGGLCAGCREELSGRKSKRFA